MGVFNWLGDRLLTAAHAARSNTLEGSRKNIEEHYDAGELLPSSYPAVFYRLGEWVRMEGSHKGHASEPMIFPPFTPLPLQPAPPHQTPPTHSSTHRQRHVQAVPGCIHDLLLRHLGQGCVPCYGLASACSVWL